VQLQEKRAPRRMPLSVKHECLPGLFTCKLYRRCGGKKARCFPRLGLPACRRVEPSRMLEVCFGGETFFS